MSKRQPQDYVWEDLLFDTSYILNKHFTPGRAGAKVEYFTVHHLIILNRDMNTDDALQTTYNVWQDRPASAHYAVDGDFIGQYVWDRDTAWANANRHSNQRTIAVEHANATLDEPGTQNDYLIDDRTFFNGARLIANGHILFGITPKRDHTVRKHSWFTSTACPGPYMDRRWYDYFDLMHDIYNDTKRGTFKPGDVSKPQRSTPQPGKAPVDQIIREVIAGVWGNGDTRRNRLSSAGYDFNHIQAEVNKLIQNLKPKEQIAREVIDGLWGNGAERFRRLTNAGYDANSVQGVVNHMLGHITNLDRVARDVIRGKWGNGEDRFRRLNQAGINAQAVQDLVNKMLL